ncbi:MAG TPA: RNA polymerase sigma factor [Thermoanaerobaculia bacterium]|nr:RNA polymerase sigma factor [Thermoanaerobaculia bacterium]
MALANQAGREGWTNATFEPVYRRYHPRFLSYLRRHVNRPEVAKELAQEVMMNVFKAPGCFDSLPSFEAWMTTIAQNVLKNHWRGANTLKRQGAEVAVEELARKGGEGPATAVWERESLPDPLEEVLRLERQVEVARALEQLPPKMRNVAVLRFKQDRGYEEIARILGVSVSTVKSQLHEAKKRLAELLSEQSEE